MTKRVRHILIILIVISLFAGLIMFLTRDKPVPVTLDAVKRGRVESVVTNTRAGTVKACRRAHLAPSTGGQISYLAVHEGDRVQAGKVLMTLWNEDIAAQIKLAENEEAAAVTGAKEACLLADDAMRTASRLLELQKKGLAADENVDQAVANAKAQRARCQAARENVRVSAARVEVARAAMERTIVKAPFSGYVAEVNGEIGEFVTPSPTGIPTPPAVDLVDTSCLYILAPIDEVDAPNIRKGMDARITLDAFPGITFKGKVSRIAPYVLEIEKQARTVDVEAVFSDPEEFKGLIPGYSADLEVVLDVHENVLSIPTEAVLEGGKVLVYRRDDGLMEDRTIKTGLSNWKETEVLSGLKEDELIVRSVDREGVKAGIYGKPEEPITPESHRE